MNNSSDSPFDFAQGTTLGTFKLPDVTPPDRVRTLEEARDALDRANQQLLDAAVRQAALERASSGFARDLGRMLAIAEDCDLDDIQAYAARLRQKYISLTPRTH